MRVLVLAILMVGPAWADDVALVEDCVSYGANNDDCFGKIADTCFKEGSESLAGGSKCWARELSAWQVALDRVYSKVLLETFTAPKSVTQRIREEQDIWSQYRDAKCAVQTMSNPRTWGHIETSCLARMTYDRVLTVSPRLGADWTEY